MVLSVVGSIALAAGVYVAVITMTRTPANHRGIGLPLHGAVYVGADTCFTCHENGNPDWSLMLDTEPVTSPVANPQGGLVDVSAHAQPPLVGGAATTSVAIIGAASAAVNQHYVVATENDHLRLPSPTHPPLPSSEASALCADCHADETAAGAVQLERETGACIICHPTVSRVSHTAQPTRAQLG